MKIERCKRCQGDGKILYTHTQETGIVHICVRCESGCHIGPMVTVKGPHKVDIGLSARDAVRAWNKEQE